jgi:syntaxin-binding protein 1
MYGQAHLLLTTGISQTLMNELAQTAVAPHVATLQELYLDFVAPESRCFHLARDSQHFSQIFAPMIPSGPEPPQLSLELDAMALQIAAACVTMGELPRVRYRKTVVDHRSARLAVRVQQKLEELAVKLDMRPTKASTLIITDRTVDLVAPFLREFSIQAMANDLLGLGPDGTRYEYSFSTPTGTQKKTVSLDERDSLWLTLRHAHIADCSNLIIERFNKFLTENKAAVKSRTSASGNDVTSLSELKDTMSALGEFQEMKSEFALHLSIAQDCLGASDRKQLIDVAGIEQNMVTGVDNQGDPIKDMWHDLAQIIDRPNLESVDRARLLAIYLLTNPSKLADTERRALFEHARLSSDDTAMLRQLLVLADNTNHRQRPSGRPKGSKRKSSLDDPPAYDVSRFHPALQVIMEDCAFEELDQFEFPAIKGDAGPAAVGRAAATSLRAKPSVTSSSTAGSVFCYVIGGVTYSEIRSVYELSSSLKRDFFVGGDCILTPTTFMQYLKNFK